MRTLDPRPCLILALALCALGPPAALAASSAASSASESIGFSIGSVSGSLKKSSASSSPATDVAAGDYEVVEIAAVDDAVDADRLRLRLRPKPDRAGADEVVLELPRLAFEAGRLARGVTVTASARPYGVEFASATTGRAFFLVLEDEWYRELRAHALPT